MGYFAQAFPLECDDGTVLVSSGNQQDLDLTLGADVPGVALDPHEVPDTLQVLDTVEFFARRVSRPGKRDYHSYFRHHHVSDFDIGAGRASHRQAVNRMLRRTGHPYELDEEGAVQHLGAPVVGEAIAAASFNTGDGDLDRLLTTAIAKFSDPDPAIRAEGLEKLWDAWERLKTLLAADKKQGIADLIEQAVPEPNLRAQIETEAKALTEIGNKFMIRHTETDKPKLEALEQVEYLFHRMFALIYMLLKAAGRASA